MLFLILCCVCISLAGVVQPLFGETPAPAENDPSESAEPWPEKLGSRSTWERIAYFPGYVVYLPLRIIFAASKETLEVVDDKSRIRDAVIDLQGLREGQWRGVRHRAFLPASPAEELLRLSQHNLSRYLQHI